MSSENDKKVYEQYEEHDEEEDKKCPAKRHVFWWIPNEGRKTGGAALVYKEEREDTKCPPQQGPWSTENEESTDHDPGKRQTHTHKRRKHEYVNQPSTESLNHLKAHREFAQKDEETIKMEEGVFCMEWEKFDEATDGHVAGSDPNERGLSNEARKAAYGSSGGRHAVSSSRRPSPGPDASPGAEAVDGLTHPHNNAQRRTHAFPPTRPGVERVPGPDSRGLDDDEEQTTVASREQSTLHVIARAVDTEEESRLRRAHDQAVRELDQLHQMLDNAVLVTPVVATNHDVENGDENTHASNHDGLPRSDDPKCGTKHKRCFAIGSVLVIVVAVAISLAWVLPPPGPTTPAPPTGVDSAGNCYGVFGGYAVSQTDGRDLYSITIFYTSAGIVTTFPSLKCGNTVPVVPNVVLKGRLKWIERIEYGTCVNNGNASLTKREEDDIVWDYFWTKPDFPVNATAPLTSGCSVAP